jgi:Putative zinc-finger
MLCAHAEKLIPLFAGDDLPARETEALRLHLESCANCRRLAAEFEESREWLRGFNTAQFDEATLDGMRDSVLRDIGRIENRARRFQWIVPGWNLRFAFATSLALLLFGALFSLAINRRQPPRHDPGSNQVELLPGKTPDDRANYDGQTERSKTVRRKFGRKPIKHSPEESPQSEAEMVEPDLITQNMAAEPDGDQSTVPNPANTDPAPNRNMLRIEIQTADPNIRIIWFAPKSDTTPNTK